MKLPKGYGSITKLKGARRKPYLVRAGERKVYSEKAKGFVSERPILGYAETKAEALKMLAEQSDRPINLDKKDMTLRQIYDVVMRTPAYQGLGEGTKTRKQTAIKWLDPIFDMKIKDVDAHTIQSAIDACTCQSATKSTMLNVVRDCFKFAMQNDIVRKDYSEYITVKTDDTVIERKIFTAQEMKYLWEHAENRGDIQVILILLYTGMRANELFKNSRENINLDERTIYIPKAIAKNKHSIRTIPIHDKILPLVKNFYSLTGETLIQINGKDRSYSKFVMNELKKLNQELNVEHTMHDTRHTCSTWGHECHLDDLCLDKILGHKPNGITKEVYTHISIDELRSEISKISYERP